MVSSRGRGRAVALLAMLVGVLFVTGSHQARAAGIGRASVRTDAGISAEADFLSGRALTVDCATSPLQWRESLAAVGLPAASADEYYGFSLIPQGVMHLSHYVCQGLLLGAAGPLRQADELQVAWSVDVLLHESTHMGRFTARRVARRGLRTDRAAGGVAPPLSDRLSLARDESPDPRRRPLPEHPAGRVPGRHLPLAAVGLYGRIVTGTPGPMRSTSHVIAAAVMRIHPCETAVPGSPPTFATPWSAIWPGPPSKS